MTFRRNGLQIVNNFAFIPDMVACSQDIRAEVE